MMEYAMREWTAICAAGKAHRTSLEHFKKDYGTLVHSTHTISALAWMMVWDR